MCSSPKTSTECSNVEGDLTTSAGGLGISNKFIADATPTYPFGVVASDAISPAKAPNVTIESAQAVTRSWALRISTYHSVDTLHNDKDS